MNNQLIQCQEEEEACNQAVRLVYGMALPMVLKSVLELNIIDTIYSAGVDKFLTASELAKNIPNTNPGTPALLDRMLCLLSSYDVVKCSIRTKENGEIERLYSAKPICKYLAINQDGGSLGPSLLLNHDKILIKTWYHLSEFVLEGGITPMFNKEYGMSGFEYGGTDQRINRIFNQAMSKHTILTMNKLLDVYKGFVDVNILVDVGGGIGVSSNTVISQYPRIKGINFDLPHVILDAPSYPGVEHIGGDMFTSVPKGDAILLKCLLHDWSDEHCLRILKNCLEALPSNGKVIVVEYILEEVPENNISSHIPLLLDLTMLTLATGGKERTRKEYEALALEAGFSGIEVVCCAYNSWIIEFHK